MAIGYLDKSKLFSDQDFQSAVWMAINGKIASVMQDPAFPSDPTQYTNSQKLAVQNLSNTHDRSRVNVLYPTAMVAAIADQLFVDKTLEQILSDIKTGASDDVIEATVNQYWALIADTQYT